MFQSLTIDDSPQIMQTLNNPNLSSEEKQNEIVIQKKIKKTIHEKEKLLLLSSASQPEKDKETREGESEEEIGMGENDSEKESKSDEESVDSPIIEKKSTQNGNHSGRGQENSEMRYRRILDHNKAEQERTTEDISHISSSLKRNALNMQGIIKKDLEVQQRKPQDVSSHSSIEIR